MMYQRLVKISSQILTSRCSLSAGVIVGVLSQQASKADVRFSSVVVVREKRSNMSMQSGDLHDPTGVNADDLDEELSISSSFSSGSDHSNCCYIQSIAEMPEQNHPHSDLEDLEAGLLHPPNSTTYRTLPAPVLEFRIANERWSSTTLRTVKRLWCRRGNQRPRRSSDATRHRQSSSTPTSLTASESYDPNGALINTQLNVSVGFQERVFPSHSSTLRFVPLNLVMDSHPFFEQVWYARHPLDENSPLLQRATRKIVKLNNGRWPRHLFDDGGAAGVGEKFYTVQTRRFAPRLTLLSHSGGRQRRSRL